MLGLDALVVERLLAGHVLRSMRSMLRLDMGSMLRLALTVGDRVPEVLERIDGTSVVRVLNTIHVAPLLLGYIL
jgi:hypothetical protein